MKKGFTLIELLIVIAIIGILAAILFVSIGQQPLLRSRDAKRLSDLDSLRTALALFYTNNNLYPADLDDTVTQGFMGALPTDPRFDAAQDGGADCTEAGYVANGATSFTNTGHPTAASAVSDYTYTYQTLNAGQGYLLQTCLEDSASKALESDCDTAPCATAGTVYDIHS